MHDGVWFFSLLFVFLCVALVYTWYRKRRRVIILDLNGVCCYRSRECNYDRGKAVKLGSNYVWVRPGWEAFRDYLLRQYHVAIWSCCNRRNLQMMIDLLFGDKQGKLLFAWDQTHCTSHGWIEAEQRVEHFEKPLRLVKEKFPRCLPFLIDDSHVKMQCNDKGSFYIARSWTPDREKDTFFEEVLDYIVRLDL